MRAANQQPTLLYVTAAALPHGRSLHDGLFVTISISENRFPY
jgi:hypothetical protein